MGDVLVSSSGLYQISCQESAADTQRIKDRFQLQNGYFLAAIILVKKELANLVRVQFLFEEFKSDVLAGFSDLVLIDTLGFSGVDTGVTLVAFAGVLRSLGHFAFGFDVSSFQLEFKSTDLVHVVF